MMGKKNRQKKHKKVDILTGTGVVTTPNESSSNASGPPPSINVIQVLFFGYSVLIVLLFTASSFMPSPFNWGFHQNAFLPLPIRILFICGLCLSLYPPLIKFIQNKSRLFNAIPFGSLSSILIYPLLAVISAAVFWLFREKAFLLGDGSYLINIYESSNGLQELTKHIGNAPLSGFITYGVYHVLRSMNIDNAAELGIRLTSIIAGSGAIVAAWHFSSLITRSLSGRSAIMLFIISTGCSQLFFGYVELYAFPFLFLMIYTIAAYKTITQNLPVLWPGCLYGLLLSSHLGMIWLLPSILFLWITGLQKRQFFSTGASLICSVLVFIAAVYVSGYMPDILMSMMFDKTGQSNLLSFISLPQTWNAYTLLSGWHLLDLFNLHLLFSPFALFILFTGICFSGISILRTSRMLQFNLILAFCGMSFVFLANFRIGMSRDWDICSMYLSTLMYAAVCIWYSSPIPAAMRKNIITAAILLTGIPTMAYIAVNSNEMYGTSRYKMLPDTRLWSKEAMAYGFENLSNWYWKKNNNDLSTVIYWIERSIEYDSTNARRWSAAMNHYLIRGDVRKADYALEHANLQSSTKTKLFKDIGLYYYSKNEMDSALIYFKKSLMGDSAQSVIANNIGTILGETKADYKSALSYFNMAIKFDPTFALAYRNRGMCNMKLGDTSSMKADFKTYSALSSR